MEKKLLMAAIALLFGIVPALAQTDNSSGDASNRQQNGENHQTATGGQSGGATGQQ